MVFEKRKRKSRAWLLQADLRLCTFNVKQEGKTYAKYRIDLPYSHESGDFGELLVHIVYLYRYVNLPASITFHEDQKLQY